MSSVVWLFCLIFVLLAAAPGDVTGYRDFSRDDANIKRTGAYAKEYLKYRNYMDLLITKARGAAAPRLHNDRQTLVASNRESDLEGDKAEEKDANSKSARINGSGFSNAEDGKEERTTDSQEHASAQDSATVSPLDSMFIEIRKPGLGSPLTETVYKGKTLTGPFNSCVIGSADPSAEANATTCYVDDAYNDRLTFSLTFRYPAAALQSQFEANPPSLELFGDSSKIAEPSFLTQKINKESSTGEISIAYGCKGTSSGTISLQLTLHFGEGEQNSTTIPWKKECKNQQNDQIEFGYLISEKEGSDLTRHPFPSEKSPMVVAPNDVSTEVFVKLGKAGAQQRFLAPYITSSNPDVTPVAVRGNHPAGGVLEGLEQTTLQVNYDCKTKGVADISLSVGIPPFENLTAVWKKDCGGRKATKLQVGTGEHSHDVVENGTPTRRYMVAIDNIGTAHSDAHLHLPGNQSDWTVYITHSESDSERPTAREAALHVGRITLTVEHPDTLAALSPKVSFRGMTGWREQMAADHIVAPGESLRVSFHFVCRALGESRVLISVPVLQYDTLEFGVAKECTRVGKARKARELVWTVGNAFGTALFVILLLCLTWCWRRKRARAKGFTALPVTER